MMPCTQILVLVHPGSACGSADFNLGRAIAREARETLARQISAWRGGVLVIDGELSDELVDYPSLDCSIKDGLRIAKESGHISQRVVGDDPDQVQRISEFVASLSEQDKSETAFTVTGAWFDPNDGEGCVGSVHKQLIALGCKAEVSESAVNVASEDADGLTEQPSPAHG